MWHEGNSDSLDTSGLVEALGESGRSLFVVAVASALDDELAGTLLRRFADTNGTTGRVLADIKASPFVLRLDGAEWTLQPAVRSSLEATMRDEHPDDLLAIRRFLAGTYAECAAQTSGRASREALWRAAVQALPVAPDDAIDRLEELVDQASGYNRGVDLDAAASLAEANAGLLADHAGEVAYLIGRRAYARRDRVEAEKQFRIAWEKSARLTVRAISSHLLANILLDRGTDSDLAEAEHLARQSVGLHKGVRSAHEVAFVEVTLARILLRDETVLEPPFEARELLDEAMSRLTAADDNAGLVLALMVRTRYFRQAQALGAAKEDSALAVQRARSLNDGLLLSRALNSRATVLIRSGGRKDLAHAAQAVSEAQQLLEGAGVDDDIAAILNTRSLLAEAEQRLDKAIAFAEEALELQAQSGRQRNVRLTRDRIRKLERLRRQSSNRRPRSR